MKRDRDLVAGLVLLGIAFVAFMAFLIAAAALPDAATTTDHVSPASVSVVVGVARDARSQRTGPRLI